MSKETVPSISDLWGLDLSCGLLDCTPGSSSGASSPPSANKINFEEPKFHSTPYPMGYNAQMNSVKNLQRNLSLGGAGTPLSSPDSPPSYQFGRPIRNSSLSDSCTSGSPSVYDSSYFLSSSSSPTPEKDCWNITDADANLSETLNSLTLNDNLSVSHNQLGNDGLNDLNLQSRLNLQNLLYLQNMQARYLQNQTHGRLNFLNPAASTTLQQIMDTLNGNLPSPTSPLNVLPSPPLLATPDNFQLERAVRLHRFAASLHDATYTWSGILPARSNTKPSGYSSKVFLGGVPWDITEQLLVQTFKPFGPIKVEWPGKDKHASQPKGYVYIIFEAEKSVKMLLQACSGGPEGNLYFKLSSKRMKAKDVQVIPWMLVESNFTKSTSQKLDPLKTVFVGALHGMLNAEGLAKIMNDLFDGVIYAGIDTDKYKYPIGSGRVTFNNSHSYIRAVAAGFIEVKTSKFSKKVDPYLEDSLCSLCNVQQGPYFCRDMNCFRYFCRICWQWQHQQDFRNHKPMMRTSKNGQATISTVWGASMGFTNPISF